MDIASQNLRDLGVDRYETVPYRDKRSFLITKFSINIASFLKFAIYRHLWSQIFCFRTKECDNRRSRSASRVSCRSATPGLARIRN